MKKHNNLVLAAILPMVAALAVTFHFISTETSRLSEQSLKTLKSFLTRSKEKELNNYTQIAVSAINHIYSLSELDSYIAKDLATNIFESMTYDGNNGYFFVYDFKGLNIVHPKQKFRVGENWWDLQDNNGIYIIRDLVKQANNGGGYVRYQWEKPSSNEIGDKLSYAKSLDNWGWMVGTGVYLDDVQMQLSSLQSQIDNHIKNTTKIIFTVALSTIVLVVMFNFVLAMRQKMRSDQREDELSQRIIGLQEDERRRISHELHDGIVQLLISIKYNLEYTIKTLTKQAFNSVTPLTNAEHTLNQAINEVRRISHEMHPRILDELGLSEAIEALANDFSVRTAVQVNLTKASLRKVLPIDVSTTLYRVAQESLVNIEKHSTAKLVKISVVLADSHVILTIFDDGVNEAQPKNYSGIGLRNLNERVEYHRGVFKYRFDKNGGLIEAKIPIIGRDIGDNPLAAAKH